MKCYFCGSADSKVVDSRHLDDSNAIRRRRECAKCGRRFTTFETVEITPLVVVKRDGNRQSFNPEKIKGGIMRACEKRPVSANAIQELVDAISQKLHNSLEAEVDSTAIGEMVMEGLKHLDEVAYIRFASVYRQFKDSQTFFLEMQKLFNK